METEQLNNWKLKTAKLSAGKYENTKIRKYENAAPNTRTENGSYEIDNKPL